LQGQKLTFFSFPNNNIFDKIQQDPLVSQLLQLVVSLRFISRQANVNDFLYCRFDVMDIILPFFVK